MDRGSASEVADDEEEDENKLDYELHFLAMQFQKYAYRRLYISDVWFIWCVQRGERVGSSKAQRTTRCLSNVRCDRTLLDMECYDVNARDNKVRCAASRFKWMSGTL